MWATSLPASKGGERPTKAIHLLRLSRGSITLAICRAREVSSMNESILGFGAVLIDHSDLSQKKDHHHQQQHTHKQTNNTHKQTNAHTHQHTNTHAHQQPLVEQCLHASQSWRTCTRRRKFGIWPTPCPSSLLGLRRGATLSSKKRRLSKVKGTGEFIALFPLRCGQGSSWQQDQCGDFVSYVHLWAA